MTTYARHTRALIVSGLFVFASAPAAGDINCPPDPGAVEIDGNIDVTGPCLLNGTEVEGNVVLFAGGSLTLRDARIDGNIQSTDSPFEVDIDASDIDGNIQFENLVGDETIIRNTRIDGNIQVNNIRSGLRITDNDVDGDIQAFGNTGGLDIVGNVVDGNLQCRGNNPAPTGEGNTVEGNRQGQCARLDPADKSTQEETEESPEEDPDGPPEEDPGEDPGEDAADAPEDESGEEEPNGEPDQDRGDEAADVTVDDGADDSPSTGSSGNGNAEKNNLKGSADPILLCVLALFLVTTLLRYRRRQRAMRVLR